MAAPLAIDASASLDAGTPAPDTVDDVPTEPEALDGDEDERLRALLLIDPAEGERVLAALPTPDAWRVELLAQLARTHGERERRWKQPPLQLGRSPPSPGMTAWVASADATWTPVRGAALALPLGAEVRVVSTTPRVATVDVSLAQVMVFGPTGLLPQHVQQRVVRGTVAIGALSATPIGLDELQAELTQETAPARRVGLRRAVWQLDHDTQSRRAWLDAAWEARDASGVVEAAMTRELAPAHEVTLAWSCRAPPPAKSPKPTGCVYRETFEERCPAVDDAPGSAWLQARVDARSPRLLFLVETQLTWADPCSGRQELRLKPETGHLRRLAFPLGDQKAEVWIEVPRRRGVEYALVSAASEPRAVAWLRERARSRWTPGSHGRLEPSLDDRASDFEEPRDVEAATWAVAPPRACDCE